MRNQKRSPGGFVARKGRPGAWGRHAGGPLGLDDFAKVERLDLKPLSALRSTRAIVNPTA